MAQMVRVIVHSRTDQYLCELDPSQVIALDYVEQLNGEHSLTITTTQELAKDDRLLVRDGMGVWHEYVVDGLDATHGEASRVVREYWCTWSLYHDLAATYVNDPYGCGWVPGHPSVPQTARHAMECALQGTARWGVGGVTVSKQNAASFYRCSGWEALQTVVEKWGGELSATIEVGLGGVVSRSANLLEHVGGEVATRRFDYGSDVASIKRTISEDVWPCRIVPVGKASETEAGGYTRRPGIASVNDGVDWLEDATAVPLVRVPDGQGGWEYPIAIVKNDEYEEPADIKAWALEHITDYTRPQVTYEADVAQYVAAGLNPHGVALGDEVVVVDGTFGDGGLRINARVVKMTGSMLDASQTQLTIGNMVPTLSGQMADLSRTVGDLYEVVDGSVSYQSTPAYVSGLISRMNDEANATGGYTYVTQGQGIRTYDVAVSDPLVGSEASMVVEVKGGNIRIANSRDGQGNWEWRTLLVAGSIASELITSAEIVTGRIGSADSGTYIDLDANEAQLGASDSFHVVVNDQELGFYDGAVRTAYVTGQKLYIPYTVVLNAMQVGVEGGNCWEWRLQDNGNLDLVWIG